MFPHSRFKYFAPLACPRRKGHSNIERKEGRRDFEGRDVEREKLKNRAIKQERKEERRADRQIDKWTDADFQIQTTHGFIYSVSFYPFQLLEKYTGGNSTSETDSDGGSCGGKLGSGEPSMTVLISHGDWVKCVSIAV
jgi:hypothetical protein